MVLPVPGFGSVYVYADNGGEGFGGGEKEIDFVYEAARTRIARVRRWLSKQETFAASSAVQTRLATAEELFETALEAGAGSESRRSASFASLQESLWAGEMAVLEEARADIARRGPRGGLLLGGGNLIARPVSANKAGRFLELFNYATVVCH